MNVDDVTLVRLIYLMSSLTALLCTSLILRGLWQPLRFVLLALTFSFFFTPYFIEQTMPDGGQQNILPAFVVAIYEAINHRDTWQTAIQKPVMPLAVVAGISSLLALLLSFIIPKPVKKIRAEKVKKKKQNPYLPEDFQPDSEKPA